MITNYGVALGEVMFADVWLPGDQHGSPYPGPRVQ